MRYLSRAQQLINFSGLIVGTTVGNRTTKRIAASSLPRLYKTPGYHCDGGGLYLQVSPSGARSWIFRYMLNKKAREMGIGSADLWDLTAARAKVVDLRRLLSEGVDPISHRQQIRRKQLVQADLRSSFEQCVDDYLEMRSSAWKNAKHALQWKNTLKTYVYPVCGAWPVEDVSEVQITAAVKPIWLTKHETATRLLQRIRLVLVWACANKRRPPLPNGIWENVASNLPSWTGKVKHHAACPYKDAGSLLVSVRGSTASEIVKLAFTFTVLTAARSGETRGAIWREIDFDQAIWTIPGERMKAGVEHRVPLSETAIAILRAAEKYREKNDLVFPTTKGKPLSDMVFTQLMRRLKASFTMHGFRSSFRDWAADESNFPSDVAEAALAHINADKVEAAYLRSVVDVNYPDRSATTILAGGSGE